MDYSKLSDFEINRLVFASKTGLSALSYPHSADNRSCGHKDINDIYHWFDFCNAPSDAWPIIIDNKLSLNNYGESWEASFEHDEPVGAFGTDECVTSGVEDKNPLRALMIAFLMKVEIENAKILSERDS
ncbi:TPA: phage protein NinX family protein [Raoultella ornithinolytica]